MLTEAEVDRIEKLWKKALAGFPGLSVGYFHESMKGGPVDVAGLCQAVRESWAENHQLRLSLKGAEDAIQKMTDRQSVTAGTTCWFPYTGLEAVQNSEIRRLTMASERLSKAMEAQIDELWADWAEEHWDDHMIDMFRNHLRKLARMAVLDDRCQKVKAGARKAQTSKRTRRLKMIERCRK